VILSPHGYFGQHNVLGMPDTGGQVNDSAFFHHEDEIPGKVSAVEGNAQNDFKNKFIVSKFF
jgi:hypothetical protein